MKNLIIVCVVGIFMAGCRTFPKVYNIEDQTVGNHTQQEIERAILAGASLKGWTVRKERDGLMYATLVRRTHQVNVEIPYDSDSYSILYKDSRNLGYNHKKETIHPRYNTWVIGLNRSIGQELVR